MSADHVATAPLADPGGQPASRPRRTDPRRRDRIVEETIELIAEVGVAGVSHRKIAARADVPLGSMTYHFTGMDELLHEAFTWFADRVANRFEAHLSAARDGDEALEALVDLVHELSGPGSARDQVLTYELYTLAARDPRYRAITTAWMARSRRELERHFDPAVTRRLDAMIEGLSLHRALEEHSAGRDQTRAALAAVVTAGRGEADPGA